MFVSAIVLAAGKGARLKSSISKPLVKLGSLPLIIYSLKCLMICPLIKEIILAVNSSNVLDIKKSIRKYKISGIRKIVLGGLIRQDSVYNGLNAIDKRADFVLIHDSARPFIDKKQVSLAINEAKKCGAAIVGVPVKATIKEVHSLQSTVHGMLLVKKTLNRENLWEIHTPQVFKKDLLLEAYKRFGNTPVSDDAALLEKLGCKVRVVFGSYSNIKITTPEDLVLAEAILKVARRE